MAPMDLYCERIAPGLLGEPLNALTNAALLIAAWFAWQYARRSGGVTGGVILLVTLMIAFSLGSALFHTFANRITLWLDRLPIAVFVATYLWLYVYRVLMAPAAIAAICVATFVIAVGAAGQFPSVLNGSIIYAPALILVVGLGLVHFARGGHERGALIGAAGVFIAALIFRSIDNSVCVAFPTGTHFLWHLLAAVALYLAMRAMVARLSAVNSSIAHSTPSLLSDFTPHLPLAQREASGSLHAGTNRSK
jgi:hypothetical protein